MKQTLLIVLGIAAALLISCSSHQEERENHEVPGIVVDHSLFGSPDSAIIQEKANDLDQRFSRLQKLTGFNGTVLYAEKGRVIFRKAYGYRDVRHRRDSLQLSDAFQLASVSKMFSAMAVMTLVRDGKVELDTDIRTYLPDFPYEGVTPHQLMTHRSGLPRYMSLSHEQWKDKKIPMDNDDMMDLFVEYHPDPYFSPDGGFHYCNTNYALLANLVEAVSGQHFEDYVQEKIFDPLDMHDSFVYQMRGDSSTGLYVEEGVPGFYHRGRRWREMENDYLNGVMGDKNVYTSVEDIFKYDQALDNGSLLPDSLMRLVFTPGSPKYWKRKDNYALGWRIRESMDSVAFHFGWWKGFRTFYIRDMRHQKMLVVLTNKDKGPGSDQLWNIIKADTLPLGRTCRWPQ